MRVPAGVARTAGLAGALALIAVATLMPQDGRGVARLTHWCWQCGSLWLADGASNVLLFLPLGVALAARGWRVPAVVLLGGAVTLLVETLQWVGLPPGRLASRGDLVANVAGTLLGAGLWRLRGWWRPRTPWAAGPSWSSPPRFGPSTETWRPRQGPPPPTTTKASPPSTSGSFWWRPSTRRRSPSPCQPCLQTPCRPGTTH